MEDREIVELYWARREEAISESDRKYGGYCHTIAGNILESGEDAEECVSDTWLRAWNAIPPQRPVKLKAFFAKIVRSLAIDRWRAQTAEKRGGGAVRLAIEELEECVASSSDVESELSCKELEQALSRFLRTLPQRDRQIFLGRYFAASPTADIAQAHGVRESNVLLILSRTRKKLRIYLQKEGLIP